MCHIVLCLQIAVFVHLSSVATAGVPFSVLVNNATVLLGGSVTLPCWLSPTTNTEGMEVRWYRTDYNSPVLLYPDNKNQMETYKNRTTLMPREPSSGLQQGDVSIRINNVTLKDAGEYHCYVSSSEHYESDSMFLKVEVSGVPPILSLAKTKDDRTNVSCTSGGWHPAPQLQWSLRGDQTLMPGGLYHLRQSSGLFSIQSWVVLSSSDSKWVSCSVFLPSRKADLKEARVDVKINLPSEESGSSPWMSAFIITLLAVTALIFAVLFLLRKIKEKNARERDRQKNEDELDTLLKEVEFTWSEAPGLAYSEDMKKHEVDITVKKDTAPACLKVTPNGKTMRDSDKVPATDYELCALGNPGFSSGQHYWEVRLKMPNIPVKTSWWVGVATEPAVKRMREQKSIPPSGLWCLYSDNKNGVHTKSGSSHYISMGSRPEELGIFLDYDNGRLSFYDTKLSSHLVTIKSSFSETVYPLFNPSKGDKGTLEILSSASPKPDADSQKQ